MMATFALLNGAAQKQKEDFAGGFSPTLQVGSSKLCPNLQFHCRHSYERKFRLQYKGLTKKGFLCMLTWLTQTYPAVRFQSTLDPCLDNFAG